jgi:hypothetical protein
VSSFYLNRVVTHRAVVDQACSSTIAHYVYIVRRCHHAMSAKMNLRLYSALLVHSTSVRNATVRCIQLGRYDTTSEPQSKRKRKQQKQLLQLQKHQQLKQKLVYPLRCLRQNLLRHRTLAPTQTPQRLLQRTNQTRYHRYLLPCL